MTWIVSLVLWMRRGKFAGPTVIFCGLFVALAGNTFGFMYFDSVSFADAAWCSIISITTIGYGDFSAKSLGARLCTVIFIVMLGLVVFSMALGWSIETYNSIIERGIKGMCQIKSSDHIVIVNFPGTSQVTRLVNELARDPEYADREVVIISDQIEELPIKHKHLQFVHGSPLLPETFERSNIESAHTAIILIADESKPQESDAINSSIVLVIEEMNNKVHTIAMCADPAHRYLFSKSKTDSIVCGSLLSMNLLVQEMQDHGIAKVFEIITSNNKDDGDTVYSTIVSELSFSLSYNKVAKVLLDHGANLICVAQDGKHHTSFPPDFETRLGDNLVYVSNKRYKWKDMLEYYHDSSIERAHV